VNRQFLSIQSKNGNTFYIVIDKDSKGKQNVYFMNLVDEYDLMAFAEKFPEEVQSELKDGAESSSETDKDGNSVSAVTYSGKITDSLSKEALTGVKISIENTDITVYSDLDGNFTINLPENLSSRNLKISYISYEEKIMNMSELTNDSIEINPVF